MPFTRSSRSIVTWKWVAVAWISDVGAALDDPVGARDRLSAGRARSPWPGRRGSTSAISAYSRAHDGRRRLTRRSLSSMDVTRDAPGEHVVRRPPRRADRCGRSDAPSSVEGGNSAARRCPARGTVGSTSRDGACRRGRRGWSPAPGSARRSASRRSRSRAGSGARPRTPTPSRRSRSSSSTTSPGVSGSGSVSESRRVAFSIPLATRCEMPSGRDVGEARHEADHRGRRGHVQHGARPAEDVEVLVERRRRVDERERLVGTLVARQAELEAARPEAAGRRPTVGTYSKASAPSSPDRVAEQPAGAQVERALAGARAPASPSPRAIRPPSRGGRRQAARSAARRATTGGSSMIPVSPALAPVVEPAHDLVQVVDARARDGDVGHGVVPRADEHLLRHRERLVEPQRRVRVAVAPAADHEDGAVDPVGDVADGAVAPVRAVGLVARAT